MARAGEPLGDRAPRAGRRGGDLSAVVGRADALGPPSFFWVAEGRFFVSGCIQAFCRERLAGSAYPAVRFYPELGDARD